MSNKKYEGMSKACAPAVLIAIKRPLVKNKPKGYNKIRSLYLSGVRGKETILGQVYGHYRALENKKGTKGKKRKNMLSTRRYMAKRAYMVFKKDIRLLTKQDSV